MFTRRRRRPAAHVLLLTTTYGGRELTVRGDLAVARTEARRQRVADPTIRRVRILPA